MVADCCCCDEYSPSPSPGCFFTDCHNSPSDFIKMHLYSHHLSVCLSVERSPLPSSPAVYPEFTCMLSSPLTPGLKHALHGSRGHELHMWDYVTRQSQRLTLKFWIILSAFHPAWGWSVSPGVANHIAAAPKAIPDWRRHPEITNSLFFTHFGFH